MENNNKNNQTTQIIASVLAIAILIVAVVGISFAAFTFSQGGKKENVISSGTITMSYTEGENGISITNAMPVSDTVGRALVAGASSTAGTATNGVFEFTVSATISGTTTINYEIVADKLTATGNTYADTTTGASTDITNAGTAIANEIPGDKVKIYVTRDLNNGSDFKPVRTGEDTGTVGTYNALTNATTQSVTGKQLATGQFTASGTHKYQLRMWVAENYVVGGTAETFAIRVNVYGAAA